MILALVCVGAPAVAGEPPLPRERPAALTASPVSAFAAPQAAKPSIFKRLAEMNERARERQEAAEEARREKREARTVKVAAAAAATRAPAPVAGPDGEAIEFRPMTHDGSTLLVAYKALGPVPGPGRCGIENAIQVSALTRAGVAVTPAANLNPTVATAVAAWLRESALPAAEREFGAALTGIVNASSYVCRTRGHRKGARLSEHSFGNALDIRAFVLADGRRFAVKRHPNGSPEARFLATVRKDACRYFTTVLGPGFDRAHADHFHFDLARHTPSNDYRFCR